MKAKRSFKNIYETTNYRISTTDIGHLLADSREPTTSAEENIGHSEVLIKNCCLGKVFFFSFRYIVTFSIHSAILFFALCTRSSLLAQLLTYIYSSLREINKIFHTAEASEKEENNITNNYDGNVIVST